MSEKTKRINGLRYKPKTTVTSLEGETRVDYSTKTFRAYLDGSERSFVTTDQVQTLENKTIDSASNTITIDADEATIQNLEVDNLKAGVLNTDLSGPATDSELPSALAVKNALAGQNEASEIIYNPALNPETTALNVQDALDDTGIASQAAQDAADTAQTSIDNHIADTVDAHGASAISNIPLGNLTSTNQQDVNNELQSDIDTRALNSDLIETDTNTNDLITLSGVSENSTNLGTFTGTIISDNNTIKGALQELESANESGSSDLSDHLNDTVDAHDASAISTDNSGNSLISTNVQSSLTEVVGRLDSVETAASGTAGDLTTHISDTSTHGITSKIVGETEAATLTNKIIDADNNTISNLEVDNLKTGVLDSDLTSVSASHDTLPSAKATKDYVDSQVGGVVVPTNLDDLSDVDATTPSNNQILTYNNVSGNWEAQDAQSTVNNLDDLLDVNVPTPSDGQVLTYNNVSGDWEAADAAGDASDIGYTPSVLTDWDSDTDPGQTNDALDQLAARTTVNETNIATNTSDISNKADSADLTLHESDTSTHGVTTIAGLTETQTFENKTIDGTSATGNNTITADADNITTDNSGNSLEAVNAQTSFDEVAGRLDVIETHRIVTLAAAETIAVRDALFVNASGQVAKLDADDDAKMEFIGFAKNAGIASEDIEVIIGGKLGGFTGLTPGELLYADPTSPGGYTQTEPTQANVYVIKIGKAISATEIIVNPDLAVSAEFNREFVADLTITNNATDVDITGLIFDGSLYRAVVLRYAIYRVTDTNEVSQTGQLRLTYKTNAGTWSFSDDFSGDNAGVTFKISALGQLSYDSTDLTGANYSSKLQVATAELFDV